VRGRFAAAEQLKRSPPSLPPRRRAAATLAYSFSLLCGSSLALWVYSRDFLQPA